MRKGIHTITFIAAAALAGCHAGPDCEVDGDCGDGVCTGAGECVECVSDDDCGRGEVCIAHACAEDATLDDNANGAGANGGSTGGATGGSTGGTSDAGGGAGGGDTTASVPSSWTCAASYYNGGAGDGCDCGCGAIDPDCGGGGCTEAGCFDDACTYCYDAAGAFVDCAAPATDPGTSSGGGAGGEQGSDGPGMAAGGGGSMCDFCTTGGDCSSGTCVVYSDRADLAFCSTACASNADCGAGFTCSTTGKCIDASVTSFCNGNDVVQQLSGCGGIYSTTTCGSGTQCQESGGTASCVQTATNECTSDSQCPDTGDCGDNYCCFAVCKISSFGNYCGQECSFF